MHITIDELDYKTEFHSTPCWCIAAGQRCNGACTGSAGFAIVRRDPKEAAALKSERQREQEDAILAQAEAIKARRSIPHARQ